MTVMQSSRKIYFGGGGEGAGAIIGGIQSAFTGVPWAQRGGIGCRITQLSLKAGIQTHCPDGLPGPPCPISLLCLSSQPVILETKGFGYHSEQEYWRALSHGVTLLVEVL